MWRGGSNLAATRPTLDWDGGEGAVAAAPSIICVLRHNYD
jgi:hypothetical protein